MADPTVESNLALIEELQSLVSADYAEHEGPEFSYPAVGQAVDDEMWQWITRAIGSGIFATGGYPYWLRGLGSDSETNSQNQMRLTVDTITGDAQSIFNGFYHKLLESMRLDFPMPLSETTYYVCLELNPLKARDPEGPISVKVYPNDLNTESGREHMILWSVTRKPNQLLTDAEIVRYRPRAAPSFTVTHHDHLPDPTTVLYGTVVFVHGDYDKDIVIARGLDDEVGGATQWESLLEPKWSTTPDGTYVWPGHGYKRGQRRIAGTVELRGRIARNDGSQFVSGGGDVSAGYTLMYLDEGNIPKQELRFITATNSYTGQKLAVITISTSGRVYGMPLLGDVNWMGLDGVRYPLKD